MAELKKDSTQDKIKALEDKIKSLESESETLKADKAAGEEVTLKRVCKALGVETEEVKAKEAASAKKKPEETVRMHVPFPVRVNQKIFNGIVEVPISTARVLQQSIGNRKTRHMEELVGKNYHLQELLGGGYAARVVSKIDETGERIG